MRWTYDVRKMGYKNRKEKKKLSIGNAQIILPLIYVSKESINLQMPC